MRKMGITALLLICAVLMGACGNKDNVTMLPAEETQSKTVPPESEKPQTTQEPEANNQESPEPQPEQEASMITNKAEIAGMTKEILDRMTLEEKIGQLFLVNFELLDDSRGNFFEYTKVTKKIRENLEKYKVGGVVFFSRNIETIEQTTKFINKLQRLSNVPLFIAVDEEGGDVARIANNKNMRTTKFPSMEEIGAEKDEEYAYHMGQTIGQEIKELGFNLNFAPVADVKTNEQNIEIGNRSFGSDAKLVASMVEQVVTGMQENNVSATLKHFPGNGDSSKDSHEGAVNIDSDVKRLRKVDFVPFKAGIKAGADMIMVSHVSIARVTGNTVPASLTELVMKDILRTELGFDGIVITDAMNMKSITERYTTAEASVKAVKAGADIVLMPENLQEAYQAVYDAIVSEDITLEELDERVERIISLKIERGVILSDTKLLAEEEPVNSYESN